MATTKTRTTKPRAAKTVVADAVEKATPLHHSDAELEELTDIASPSRLFATAAIGSATYVGAAFTVEKRDIALIDKARSFFDFRKGATA